MQKARVRFGPSPTGKLHVGGLRTALFNYLFARKMNGTFILRIEDTDQERYVEGAEQGILEMLEWAGITPDEGPHKEGDCGPYRQSERLGLYREAVEKLLEKGFAYKCYCTPEELDEMRENQQAQGLSTKYDGRHRNITQEEMERYEAEGKKAVVRMRIPERDEIITVRDLVRGDVDFNSNQLDDQVLMKSDGFPTYHLAVVVDDNAMGITHILRAEEWLPSTPKHILLYRWLELSVPEFAHLPLLLNHDRSKMSKRKGDVAVEDYKNNGYLPEGLMNFLSLLGWNPGDDREIMEMEEVIEAFSIERVGKAGAVFDREKLGWMNQHYLKSLSPEELIKRLRPFIDQTEFAGEDEGLIKKICLAVQPGLVTLADIGQQMALFFRPEDKPISAQVIDLIKTEDARRIFQSFREKALKLEKLDKESFFATMKEVQKETEIKGKSLWAPMRAAITRETEGPELYLIAEIFGKEKTLERIEKVLAL